MNNAGGLPKLTLSHLPEEEEPYPQEYHRLVEENERLLNRIAELETSRMYNNYYTSLLEKISDGVFILDSDYRCTFANAAVLNLLGTPIDNILGVRFTDFSFKGFGKDLYKFYRDVLTGHQALQTEVYSKNLNRWFNMHAVPCYSGGLIISLHDITERKAADCPQYRAEKFWAAITHSSPHIMFIVSRKGSLMMVNDRFLENVDCQGEEVIGRNIKSLTHWVSHEDQVYLSRQLKEKQRVRNVEIKYRSRNGSLKTALVSAERLLFEGEDCALIYMNDVTEIKRLEEKLFQQKRLHLIGEIAAGIGHEIRNPMTTVRGFLQMFKEERDWQKCKNYLDLMISELDRANDIISEFIYLAQDKAVYKAPYNLNKVLESMLVLLQATAIEKGMVIRLSLSEVPGLIFDESEIRQMILNLTRNGIEAMNPGGVLTLKTYLNEHSQVVLEVIDQGGKIELEVQKKMGTPFFSTKEGGTGLGLAACHSIANRNNARISFDNTFWGTTVKIIFDPNEKS